ncbi:kinase-like domain-containing protein [Cokeromyces recurvatus]|uniref:kinase-like domain-containing protein n=1 Tax=Cokeromyces recurvatus TaxID=90255 RepID=UPI002220DEA6|nr:kinase-like domain-containing protein [Cokeromyces recurvatus]KAI7906704.1 kinase-like domain-containing protein [Cokeromyces recurvatus]
MFNSNNISIQLQNYHISTAMDKVASHNETIAIHPLAMNDKSINRASLFSSTNTIKKEEELTVSARSLMHHDLNPEFNKKYILGQELGTGGYGFVVSAYERETGIERAVKFIIRHKVPSSAWVNDPQEDGLVPMEIYCLKHIQHTNIIHYLDSYKDDVYFYLVMEIHGTQWTTSTPQLLTHDSQTDEDEDEDEIETPTTTLHRPFVRRTSYDLFECIERHKKFNETLAKHIFKQVVECVAYLDAIGICHRDIKDENIVIDNEYKVKLIDFGSAVILPRSKRSQNRKVFTKFYGTISFASPEILMSKPYYAEPAEIWSLGVLLFTLLFGEVPFSDSKSACKGRILFPDIAVSQKARHLISSLLIKNPAQRPDIHEVLSHPWLVTLD